MYIIRCRLCLTGVQAILIYVVNILVVSISTVFLPVILWHDHLMFRYVTVDNITDNGTDINELEPLSSHTGTSQGTVPLRANHSAATQGQVRGLFH